MSSKITINGVTYYGDNVVVNGKINHTERT